MGFLSLGSIVHLKDDKRNIKLMIISYLPRVNENGKGGCFDYAACVYPYGRIQDDFYYININNEGIDNAIFKGYTEEFDKKPVKTLSKALKDY